MCLPKPTDASLPPSCPVTSSTMPPCPASFARLLRFDIATQPHSPQGPWRSPRPNKDSSDCSTTLFVVQRSNKIVSLPVLSDASGRRRPPPPSSARTRGCSVAADIRTPLTILPSHHDVIYARSLARSTICRAPTTAEIDVMVRPLHTHMKTTTTIIHPPLAAMSPQAHYPSPDSHSSHPIPGARISSPLVARRSFRFMSLSGDHAFGRARPRGAAASSRPATRPRAGSVGGPNARRRGAHPCVAHVLCDPMPRARSRDNGDDAALRFGCSARLGGSLERCGCGHWWVLRSHSCSLSPSSSSWRALEVRFGSSGVRCALPAPLALARFCGGRWSRRDERRSTATRG